MKSRYASDGQGRQVQHEGKTPTRVAKVIGSVANQVRRAALPDVENCSALTNVPVAILSTKFMNIVRPFAIP